MLNSFYTRLLIGIAVTVVSTFLFKQAAGTLSFKKMNTISFSYYLLLVTCLIGGIAIFCGFRNHYVITRITNDIANKGFFIIAYTMIALPIFIILFNRMVGIKNYSSFYMKYISTDVIHHRRRDNSLFSITVILAIICVFSVAYTLYYVGHITIIDILKGQMYAGGLISREFRGNTYIRNIFALGLTPNLSYFCYIYYYYTKKQNWKLLFWVLFIASILIKTYDYSKAPIVIYLFYFYLIKILIGDVKNNKQFFIILGFSAALLLGIYYYVVGYSGKLVSFTNGPMSRLMVSQIAGLFMHVRIFPQIHPYLMGASFPRIIGLLLGKPGFGTRSGRIVMEVLYPSSVADNTVGVMNTLFAGEAYANYGMIGVFLAPIIVAFCLSVIPNFILSQRKTPITITLYILFTYTYCLALIGGFVDYIYNVLLFILLILFVMMQVIIDHGKIYIHKKFKT